MLSAPSNRVLLVTSSEAGQRQCNLPRHARNASQHSITGLTFSSLRQGDLAAYESTWRGTHRGTWRGIAPTGKRVEWRATCFRRLVDGKVVEGWGTYNWLGVLEQNGATVTPAAG